MNVFQSLLIPSQLLEDKQALVFEGSTFTFGELERLSAHAASRLRQLDVQRGDRVAMVIPNVPAFVVWYYASLRIGAVVVSISTRLAAEEVAFILSDSGARLLVATDEHWTGLSGQLSDLGIQSLSVSDDASTYEGEPLASCLPLTRDEWVDADPDEPAVILYTSGTTGFPKGATLSHQNVRATVHAFNHLCEMQRDDRILLGVPLFHCYGQNALLNSGFNVGATLILQRRADLAESKDLIRDQQITKLFGVPTTFQLMLESCSPDELSSVGYCFSAAATLPRQIADSWRERFGQPIYEGYGLTETAPFASYNHRTRYVPGSIGTPVDLVEMKIVDPDTGEACQPGDHGEIVIRGPNVMLGYWNRPEETERAIRDGWFRSGDIGFCDSRGFFYIVDRLKDMISIGGMKVFPAEVERVLMDHPAISEVAVVGLPDDIMGERVAAFIVADGETPSLQSLHEHCRSRLGTFKAPKHFEFLQELPRNPAGKVLKTKLREQWAQAPQGSKSESALVLETVAEGDQPLPQPLLVDQLLAVHSASRHRWLVSWLQQEIRAVAQLEADPAPDLLLLDAGLDSIMIVELRDRLQQQVGVHYQLPATLVFDHPRINELAAHLLESLPLDNGETVKSSVGEAGTHTARMTSSVRSESERIEAIQEMSEQAALLELMRELND